MVPSWQEQVRVFFNLIWEFEWLCDWFIFTFISLFKMDLLHFISSFDMIYAWRGHWLSSRIKFRIRVMVAYGLGNEGWDLLLLRVSAYLIYCYWKHDYGNYASKLWIQPVICGEWGDGLEASWEQETNVKLSNWICRTGMMIMW